MDPDGPIGVIASGSGAAALVADLRRRMPHEDVISMSDDGHPAWARLRGAFVQQRVHDITVDLCNAGAKLIILDRSRAPWMGSTWPVSPRRRR